MKLINQLNELQNEGVITPQIASDISGYYALKGGGTEKRQTVIFSVIGSLLVGLGLILVFAHNWDELGKVAKTVIAILPLIISQIIGGIILVRKKDSLAAREGIGTLLMLCIGLAISLVGQIYNLPGDLGEFLKVWMILALPLVYLLRSSMVAFLVLGGITWFGLEGHHSDRYLTLVTYWLFIAAILPFFYNLFKKDPNSNYINIATWLIPIALSFGLITFDGRDEEILFLGYFLLFTFFQWFGNSQILEGRSGVRNGLKVLCPIGILTLLFVFSFKYFSRHSRYTEWDGMKVEWIAVLLILVPLGLMMFRNKKQFLKENFKPLNFAFIPFVILFLFDFTSPLTALLVNLIILFIGIHKVVIGIKEFGIGQLNLGLLIISILVTCRFFDQNMSFIVRGLVFLLLGGGFLACNLWILKNRKDEK